MHNQSKIALPDHPIHELIASRFSPYAYDPRPVEQEKLLSCLEAARWSPSSFNEQPWAFLLSQRDDQAEFGKMLDCLMEANQSWAKNAGALLITVAAEAFTRNNNPNRVCDHDVGLAVASLTLQATALGLHVHQMAGINLSKARQAYGIPESHHPLTALTIGYAADPSQAEDKELAKRDLVPRQRKPLAEFVYTGRWSQPAWTD